MPLDTYFAAMTVAMLTYVAAHVALRRLPTERSLTRVFVALTVAYLPTGWWAAVAFCAASTVICGRAARRNRLFAA